MTARRIALIDPDPALRRIVDQILTMEGFAVLPFERGADSIEAIVESKPALVIMDTWLEEQEAGWRLYDTLREKAETADLPIVVCSSDPDQMKLRPEIFRDNGRVSILAKPFDPEDLVSRIRHMLAD